MGEEERLGGGCTGPSRGEELFVQVLGHVHYLPAAWRGRAHTKDVAAHFQQLFQFRAVSGILIHHQAFFFACGNPPPRGRSVGSCRSPPRVGDLQTKTTRVFRLSTFYSGTRASHQAYSNIGRPIARLYGGYSTHTHKAVC